MQTNEKSIPKVGLREIHFNAIKIASGVVSIIFSKVLWPTNKAKLLNLEN